MGLIKKVTSWSHDNFIDYLSVNPTRDEVTHYKVDPNDESDKSIHRLHTVKDFGSITCLDYSYLDAGLVGVGEKNGYVRLFNIMADLDTGDKDYNENDVDNNKNKKTPIGINIRAKQQRCINALGINSNGLIAMGLDRNRNDSSLQIWDINYQNVESDVANIAFAYCVNESIISLKFLNDTNILAASSKFIKEIDVRVPQPIYQHPTRLTYDIKLNPFNDWQFSTYGDDGTLAIWDRRKITDQTNDINQISPLITFEKLVGTGAASRKYMNTCFRWSTIRKREFATLHRGDTIKLWRLGATGGTTEDSNNVENLFVSTVHDIDTTFDRVATFDYIPKENFRSSLLCMRQSGTVYRMPLKQCYSKVSFNTSNSLLLSNGEISELDEIRINQDAQKANSENITTVLKNLSFEDLDVADEYQKSVGTTSSEEEDYLSDNEDRGRRKDSKVDLQHNYDNEQHYHLEAHSSHDGNDPYQIYWKAEKLLQKDISVIMKSRAELGYGLDPMTTVEMIDTSKALQNNAYIRNTWRWIAIAKSSVDDGTMVSGDLDLGYQGVLGIWNGLDGISNQNRYSEDTILTEKQLNREMEKIIKLRKKEKENQGYKTLLSRFADSPKHMQRKLCLIISGWDLSPADYEDKYHIIIKNGNYEKAAAWAVFFGDIPKAVDILADSKNERLRLIATAIAGYMAYKDQPGNNSWRQQCRKMSSELEDPYLRVIFAFIADNDWWDILYEPAISLRERLGVALRFLNDTDLSKFLQRTSSIVIANGELEGLILTGITPNGIDLLQSYVNKTSDIQSAALISIFGSPKYFRDERVDEWIERYRTMLNSWNLFSMRAKFDVLRTKLSRTSSGIITAVTKPRQLYIQCIHCKKNVNNPKGIEHTSARNILHNNIASLPKMKGFRASDNSDEIRYRYACPHCGTPFPRCAICLMPLGTSNLPFVINGTENDPNESTKNTYDVTSSAVSKANSENGNDNTKSVEPDNIDQLRRKKLRLNEWFSFCLSCNHGMHAGHSDEWFEKHSTCPTPGCNCQCNKQYT
ncbi:Sea4p NDAI_0E04600 [Naumovozyma dairenensis CBS 421]|uniref:Uncharacterized protein n=1 Tax=Naumovozyma dairenensis (strain ATCC 10597 / BCRC 20456 / CBS 421 / NBRC 0211 / NRRL Y-12639) TaxID=1071378 RepID=G0WC07_NAUDC|nr:hypothetical protein NDAI_0E04600 [Naumovozyma dairenensis CBS 421]CCD25277.1 hypothetical protein NDAI_0E04600 [Naumovozyma dairenensis CBS 421]